MVDMARKVEVKATVRLVTPSGVRVTVAADSAEAYKKRGYKAAGGRAANPADEKKDAGSKKPADEK